MWNFWSGKTFKSFEECYSVDSNTFVIANVPYSRVDLFYSTEEELLNVIKLLEQYTLKTNQDIRKYWFIGVRSQKDILFIIDESHLYFDSRSSLVQWNNMESMKLILTQCRKRKIRMVFITQRLTQIDVRIRRLADYVEEYHRSSFFWLNRVKKSVYENRWDIADIETDSSIKVNNEWELKSYKEDAKLYSEFVPELTVFLQLFSFFNESYRNILREHYQTYYVCWQKDNRTNVPSLQKFEELITLPLKERLTALDWSKKNLPTIYKLYAWFVKMDSKVWNKINKILHTESKSSVVETIPYLQENQIPNKINMKRLIQDDEKKELSLSEKLKLRLDSKK